MAISVSIVSVAVLLTSTLPANPHGTPRSNLPFSNVSPFVNNPTAPVPEYPYIVSPSLYPAPSNFSPANSPSLVQLASALTGSDYLLFANSSSEKLWLAAGTYSAADARALFLNQTCVSGSGSTCIPTRSVYVTWGQPAKVYTASNSPITADALASSTSTLVFGATVSGQTTIMASSNAGGSVATLGSVSGTVTSLSETPESALATTLSSGSLVAATFSLDGGLTADPTIASGIQNASGTWVATTFGYEETVAASIPSTDSIEIYTSTNGGTSFSAGAVVATLNETSPSAIFNSIGSTLLAPPGGLVGQVATAAVGSELFVLYTNRVDGRVQAEAEVSPNGGGGWEGPYLVTTTDGSIENPALTVEPDGDVLATWLDNSNRSWQVDQQVFSPEGLPLGLVGPIPASGGDSSLPYSAGSTAVTVDSLGRPLYAWIAPASSGGTQIDYSGAFLSAGASARFLEQLVTDPLEPGDVVSGSLHSFVATADSAINRTLANISLANKTTGLSGAQNTSVKAVVPEVTALTLNVTTNGFPKVAAATTPLERDLGVFSPNVYLGVASAQLINALGGSLASSPFTGVPAYGLAQGPTVPSAVRVSSQQGGQTATVTVTSTPQNPDSIYLLTSGSFPEFTSTTKSTCVYGGVKYTETIYRWSEPSSYWSNVTLVGGATGHFSLSSALPSVYLTNLTPQSNVSWSGVFAADYVEYMTVTCDTSNTTTQVTPVALGVDPFDVSVSASSPTSLAIIPGQPYLLSGIWKGSKVPTTLTAYWNNSMLAQGGIWVNFTSNGTRWAYSTNSLYAISETASWPGFPASQYTAQLTARSETGGYSSSEKPAVSGGDTTPYPAEQASVSCTFNLSQPSYHLWWVSPSNVSGVTGSSVQIQWDANTSGLGSVTYYEVGTGVNYTIAGVSAVANTSSNSSTWMYTVGLHNLDPWAVYEVTIGVGVGGGCLQKTVTRTFAFRTQGVLTLHEFDDPYDSVSREGGGATVWWQLPLPSAARFVSGALFWQNTTATVQLPLSNTSEFQSYPKSMGMVNLSLPQGNSSYTVWALLNYSSNGQAINLTSTGDTFVYLRDTSGDGLTDQEKINGWTVPITNVSGKVNDQVVEANPLAYSSNGLVGDYVEKEFDLNLNTVDTAGSHMLDTWNLTFSLGPSGNLPSTTLFRYWYENTTFNPFAAESPPASAQNLSNITATPSGGIYSGDGSPWASTVLWSSAALAKFENLSGVEASGWLRAVSGSWKGLRTLTVWGKLSWGANPLAQSTSGDGVIDGRAPDPLTPTVLQLNITNWSATLKSGSDQAAPYVEVSSGSGGTGTVYYGGYGPGVEGKTVFYNRSYVVSVPVASTSQFVYFNVSLNDAYETSAPTTTTLGNVSSTKVDLVGTQGPQAMSFSGQGARLSGSYQVVRAPEVSNTLLWVPANNTTLSSNPWGLKRYTAEPDFDLFVLNASAKTTVTGVEGAEGGWQYSVTLQQGLNNILVPRGAFLGSPLGQALINNTNDTSIKIPSGSGVTFHPTDWSGRSETSSANAVGNQNFIWVFSTKNQSESNTTNMSAFGGLPQNSAVEAGQESRQVQAVYWANVTTTGNGLFASESAELDDLIGGLILNLSGNLTGNLLNVTSEVPTLGLPTNVRTALANATIPSGGNYSAPEYQPHTQSPPWWEKLGSIFVSGWNTLTGLATKAVSAVWNLVQAASAYVGMAFTTLSNRLGLGKLASQVVSGLKTIASAMELALNVLWNILKTEVISQLSTAWSGIRSGLSYVTGGYASPVAAAINGAGGTRDQIGPLNPLVGSAALGGGFLTIQSFLSQIAPYLDIALLILSILTLGATTVIVFLVSEIVSLLFPQLTGQGSRGSPSALSGFFGFAWWTDAVHGGGIAINATLKAEGKSLNGTQQTDEDLALGLYQSTAEFGAALAAWGAAVSIASTTLTPFLFAALYLVLACVGAMMSVYVFTTSITNYQAGHATGKALAVLSAGMAVLGALGMGLLLVKYPSQLTPNVRLLIYIGWFFVFFDVFAAAEILST